MHEVGHSLGLRHNFKASIMLRPDQINDTSITRVKGMTGSVMDYNPINVAPKGQKQGDYASTTIGPYDYWAIEYAYSPVKGNEEAELKKIAARSPDPDLAFATDDDFMNNDPQVNTYDLTSDTLAYGKMRMAMASELLKDLDQKVVKDGESWARLRGGVHVVHQPVRQRGVPGGRIHRRPVGQPRLQGDRQGPRSRSRRSPAPGSARPSSCWSTRSSATRPSSSRPALLRKLITESWQDSRFSYFGSRITRSTADPQHPGDRARPVPRSRRAPADPEPGDPERSRQRPDQDRRGLPLAERRHLHRGRPRRRPVARRRSRSRPSGATFSASTSSGSAPWSSAPRTIRRSAATRFVIFFGMAVVGARRRQEPGAGCTSTRSARRSTSSSSRRTCKIDDTTLAHLKEIRFRDRQGPQGRTSTPTSPEPSPTADNRRYRPLETGRADSDRSSPPALFAPTVTDRR